MSKNLAVKSYKNNKNGKNTGGNAGNSALEQFISLFFSGNGKNTKTSSASVEGSFEFLQKRKVNEPKIEIANYETEGSRPRTIVRVLNDDKPFLVDSVVAEINRSGYKIFEINHPILKLERDAKGQFVKFAENGASESLIHIEVASITKEQRAQLDENLQKSLRSLYSAVTDWRDMLRLIDETISNLRTPTISYTKEEISETVDFLLWIAENHFTFLGAVDYKLDEKTKTLKVIDSTRLGVLRADLAEADPLPKKLAYSEAEGTLVEITKSDNKAVVHRSVYMDQIGVKKFDKDGNIIGERLFLGLFAYSAYYQTASQIPIIRKKLEYVLQKSGFSGSSHSGKITRFILDSYPRDEIFQSSVEQLYNNSNAILELMERPDVGLFLRKELHGRFISCLIYVPKEKFDTGLRFKIQAILEKELNCTVTEYYTQITDSPLSRLHLILKPNAKGFAEYDVERIRTKIADSANLWEDQLAHELFSKHGERKGDELYSRYDKAFPKDYTAIFSASSAVHDIARIENSLTAAETEVELYQLKEEEGNNVYHLKTFSPNRVVTLSDVLPVLENLGLKVIAEQPYEINIGGGNKVDMSNFELTPMNGMKLDLELLKPIFEDAFKQTIRGIVENDSLNKLVLFANMPARDVALLRAYSKYLMQAGLKLGLNFFRDALTNQPEISKLLVQLFYSYFEPKGKNYSEELLEAIEAKLGDVTNLNEDRALRRLLETLNATLRTNFFLGKNYFSFKFDSRKVPELPLPRPVYEIFVYSTEVEGIHLRGGMVARGGLRWSDRNEDFRTEVLGLMKAQMVKNSVIVPVGSKGGFVVKQPLEEREAKQKQGIECYKTFLRGILDITDNIIAGKITTPKNVERRDGEDPYLVVAADKGTATFSDIANSISAEYNFWLDDAFASGGSVGYDHKKMGITAKGGWISVQRHFREIGVDVQKDEFTVVGIGDMAGDVFGNGMLLSDKIKLVAAFNHMHIFFDPAPDAAKSFKERERLFALPRSSWEDYDKKLISKGGAIFKRSDKSIKLTPEVQAVLGTSVKEATPDELIRLILTSPVDLLWNGGIGTYVKSHSETHRDVSDKNNDNLRVDGRDLKCKVIGEGGNLGCTQLGRIEYALKGGRINTDAIDNSAGVDCSDHEVNIKIALKPAVEKKKLTSAARDKLLEKMTDEVGALVLRDNYLQTQALSIAEKQGAELLESQAALMRKLGDDKLLDRAIEFLPTDEEIAVRINARKGLTRPELAVILAYSKLSLYQELLDSSLPDEDYFKNDLMLYFPEEMRKSYKAEIENHKLKREIVATFVTNSIVNRAGATFFNGIIKDTGQNAADVARAYTGARDIFSLRNLWKEIEGLDAKVPASTQYDMFVEIGKFIERQTFWFLRNSNGRINIEETVKTFKSDIENFTGKLGDMLNKEFADSINATSSNLQNAGVPEALAKTIAGLPALASACDIALVAKTTKLPLEFIGKLYFELGDELGFNWLRAQGANLTGQTYWQRLALRNMVDSLFEHQRRLALAAAKLAGKNAKPKATLEAWETENMDDLVRHGKLIAELKATERTDLAMLVAAVKRVETLCNK